MAAHAGWLASSSTSRTARPSPYSPELPLLDMLNPELPVPSRVADALPLWALCPFRCLASRWLTKILAWGTNFGTRHLANLSSRATSITSFTQHLTQMQQLQEWNYWSANSRTRGTSTSKPPAVGCGRRLAAYFLVLARRNGGRQLPPSTPSGFPPTRAAALALALHGSPAPCGPLFGAIAVVTIGGVALVWHIRSFGAWFALYLKAGAPLFRRARELPRPST